jgi:PAT family beta-lactamase induction signal transducer AmpG
VYFTDVGVRERLLGYLNFLGVPWNLKFLWAPLVDRFGSKRRWLVWMQGILGTLTVGIGLLAFRAASMPNLTPYLQATAVLLVAMAFLAATNDVAVDAYYLEAFPRSEDQASYSGYRVLAYRVSMVFARTGLVALAAWGGGRLGTLLGWGWAFGAGGATLIALALVHQLTLPRVERAPQTTSVVTSYLEAWRSYLLQDRVVLVLLFIAVYKLGDEILFSMATPFLMRELHVTKDQYAWIGGVVGAAGTIVGAMWGGVWIRRWGLARALFPLTLLMNLNIWAYIWLAWARPSPTTTLGLATIAAVHGYEQIAAGLGNAALLVFLLGTCKPQHRAAHYAIGSAIMSLGSSVLGGFGGWVVEQWGYRVLFLIAFAATVPSMVLLRWVPVKPAQSPALR